MRDPSLRSCLISPGSELRETLVQFVNWKRRLKDIYAIERLGSRAAMPSSRGARRNECNTYENRTLDWASRQTAGRVILGRRSLSLHPRTLPRCKDEATTNYLRLRMLIGPSPPKKESSFHTANFYFSSALQNPRYWENQLRLRAVLRGLRWDGRRALT